MAILSVKCPHCGNTMNMKTKNPSKARKKCNFCQKGFSIHKNVNDSQIVKKVKGKDMNIEIKDDIKLPNGQEFDEAQQ